MLVDTHRRNVKRGLWTLALGLLLGALLTQLAVVFLPESAARTFLTLTVDGSIGPLAIDLAVFAFTIGPVILSLNVLTLVGIAMVAFIVRSWI
ncbi:MAG TPA: hypothetical protein EYQ64_11285 [Gemmatimonadetes bacterium]|nr:hypothetical protein [Gemmatimonadota bacterium]